MSVPFRMRDAVAWTGGRLLQGRPEAEFLVSLRVSVQDGIDAELLHEAGEFPLRRSPNLQVHEVNVDPPFLEETKGLPSV